MKLQLKPNQVFERLTTIRRVTKLNDHNKYWLCKCSCGKFRIVRQGALYSKATKSCGCYHRDSRRASAKPNNEAAKKSLFYDYRKNAEKRNNLFSLTFDEFLNLINKNCFYCRCSPFNTSKRTKFSWFKYNGIDRINNSKGYEIGNVVSCCKRCNYSKWKFNQYEFLSNVNKIYINQLIKNKKEFKFDVDEFINNSHIKTLFGRYRRNAINGDRNLIITLEQFAKLVRQNCYYCGSSPSFAVNSKKSISTKNFLYNGLDRIINSGDYEIKNVVPCCTICNFMKAKVDKEDFLNLIFNIYRNHNN